MNLRLEHSRSTGMVSRVYGRRFCIFLVNSFLFSFWSLPPAQADEVRLKNGNVLSGTVENADEQQVTVDIPGTGQLTLERSEIASIEKSSNEKTQTVLAEPNQLSDKIRAEEKYSNPTLGVSVVKPPDWSVMRKLETLDNLPATNAKEAVLKMVAKLVTVPLVILTKYKEPYDDINPTFTLDAIHRYDFNVSSPKAVVEAVAAEASVRYEDMRIVQGPEETTVNGRDAGYVGFNYTMKVPDGRTFPVRGEIWVILRNPYVFLITAGTRQDEKTGTRDEIKGILNSLVIEN